MKRTINYRSDLAQLSYMQSVLQVVTMDFFSRRGLAIMPCIEKTRCKICIDFNRLLTDDSSIRIKIAAAIEIEAPARVASVRSLHLDKY